MGSRRLSVSFAAAVRAFIRISLLVGWGVFTILPANASAPREQPVLLVLGDSISAAYGIQTSEGWVALLEERLRARGYPHRVVNASISGETTGGGLARLEKALATHDPDLVILELGGNDGLRGYPIDRIRDNLTRMVQLVRDQGRQVLLVGMQIPPNYGHRYTAAFSNMFREVAAAADVPLVPFLLERVALEPEMMQGDGIHPTAAAQPSLVDTVWPYLEPLLSEPG